MKVMFSVAVHMQTAEALPATPARRYLSCVVDAPIEFTKPRSLIVVGPFISHVVDTTYNPLARDGITVYVALESFVLLVDAWEELYPLLQADGWEETTITALTSAGSREEMAAFSRRYRKQEAQMIAANRIRKATGSGQQVDMSQKALYDVLEANRDRLADDLAKSGVSAAVLSDLIKSVLTSAAGAEEDESDYYSSVSEEDVLSDEERAEQVTSQ